MMRAQRSGFTLVELLIVSVLTAITLAGVYQALLVQEKSYEAAALMIHDQESLRVALGILESELREVGSIGGADIGGSDITLAASDSITFRAHRKTGFICKMSRNDKWAVTWVLGDGFEAGDPLLLFVDGDSVRYADDKWDTTTVTSAQSTTDTDCSNFWSGIPLQLLKLENHDLAGVAVGAPMRAYEWVTYHLHNFGPLGWGLARSRDGDEGPAYLVGGLAEPGTGLVFEYFTPAGSGTTNVDSIARLRITVTTKPETNTSVEAASMTTNLFLRNN